MKISTVFNKTLVTLSLLTLPVSGFSSESLGGHDSGGGNAVSLSSPQQVKRMIHAAWSFAGTNILNARHNPRGAQFAPRSVELLREMSSAFGDLQSVSLDVRESGACVGANGEESDASTLIGRFPSPICVSVPRLTRIAPASLYSELIALLTHELSHQFGANEAEAQALQNEMLREFPRFDLFNGSGAARFNLVSTLQGMSFGVMVISVSALLDESEDVKAQIKYCMAATEIDNSFYDVDRQIRFSETMVDPILSDADLAQLRQKTNEANQLAQRIIKGCEQGQAATLMQDEAVSGQAHELMLEIGRLSAKLN